MAKGNSNSAAVQFKVHLKPTEVGVHVMKRMKRPHLDKSAELRRFIELGYAAEQAGFILDGTVLRHAGRMWDTQPDIAGQAYTDADLTGEKPAAGRQRAPAARQAKSKAETASQDAGETSPVAPSGTTDVTSTATSSMRGKLRGLYG